MYVHLFLSPSKHICFCFCFFTIFTFSPLHKVLFYEKQTSQEGWSKMSSETCRGPNCICFMFWRHFYSGFRPNECFIVCNSFLKIIPVDHCSLYEKCYEYMFLFLIKCDSSVLYMCCAPAFFVAFRLMWD